jgi:hypothetical protein
MLRSWEDAMAVTVSCSKKIYLKCWGLETMQWQWAEAICECFLHLTLTRFAVQWNSRVCLQSSEICGVCSIIGWVCPFEFPRKPRIILRVHYFFGWVRPFKIPRKLWRSPSFEKIWASPSFKIPRNHGKTRVARFFWVGLLLKNCWKPQKNPNI